LPVGGPLLAGGKVWRWQSPHHKEPHLTRMSPMIALGQPSDTADDELG